MLKGISKTTKLILASVIFLVFILPNIINSRERKAFSDEHRIETAKERYNINMLSDTVEVSISNFYDRGSLVHFLFGKHYRDIWSTNIPLPVFDMSSIKGGLALDEVGGGQQTFSVKLDGKDEKSYTLRSVNKDQSRALPGILRSTCFRTLFRDQASAVNPFGALVTNRFENALNILHTHPKMYFVPYDGTLPADLSEKVAGRVMILEEEPGDSWVNEEIFESPQYIVKTEELFIKYLDEGVRIDSAEYLKCRLLDMLISDWDRHGGQWEWAVFNESDQLTARPIAMDRDMAFYKFNDGFVNKFALAINNKFQSFDAEFGDIEGLMRNSEKIDKFILQHMPREEFIRQAEVIQTTLTDSIIKQAFRVYPQSIYEQLGEKHINILTSRKNSLREAATAFYENINN